MQLTGKAKAKFEEWYIPKKHFPHIVNFYGMEDSFQWGVYQDWADGLGFYFDIEKRFHEDGYVCFGNHNFEKETDTRQEARNAAIEKLNELLQ